MPSPRALHTRIDPAKTNDRQNPVDEEILQLELRRSFYIYGLSMIFRAITAKMSL
jgi:hypothetical protein